MKMKKITLNQFSSYLRIPLLMLIGLIALSQNSSAQCSLACNANTQISLNSDCQAVVTPDMILNGSMTSCSLGVFEVVVTDLAGNVIPGSPVVTDAHLGKTWMVSVRDTSVSNGNECWGYITVEDKIAPTITCNPPTGPVYCFQIDDYAPQASDNCSAIAFETTEPLTTLNNCQDPNIPDSILMIVSQSFYAVDASGNVSEECELVIMVSRIEDLEDIDAPDQLILADGSNLQCDDLFAKLPNGNPSPVDIGDLPGTGVPMIDTFDLYPSDGQFCNLITTYTDTELPTVGCVTKIMRKWDIFEWTCSNPQRDASFIQMIEIMDTEGPTFDAPRDFIGSTSGYDCEGYVNVPALHNLADNCSEVGEITVIVDYDGGSITSNGGIAPLPVGVSEVIYIVADGCGNITRDTVIATVEDQTPPVTVCDQNTTIGLTNGGEAYVNAITFDDGSYDDCALESFVVRRMEEVEGQESYVACQPCKVPEFTEFTYLGEYNDHHYYISKWAKSPRVAYRYAEALGGYVYSVNSLAENTAVNDFVKTITDVDEYVIGLSDDTPPSYEHKTWDDGSNSTFRYFESHVDPNPFVKVSTETGRWDTEDMTAILPFIVEIEDVCGFSTYAKFCCEDLGGDDKMVVFRAIDAQGNYNDCMVNVEVQDKVRPVLNCLPDTTVNCQFDYDPNRLSDAFGMPTFVGNCDPIMIVDSVTDLNQCYVGTITRTFSLVDARGAILASCDQKITFENNEHFDLNRDVRPPADTTFAPGCADPTSDMFLPINTGIPTFVNEDFCDLVGYNYTDQVFTFNSGSGDNTCFKILRTFNIIDWCAPENSVRTVPYYQEIKVVDDSEPVITTSCEPVFQCTYDSECENGNITLTQTANDTMCSAILDWVAIVRPFQSSDPRDEIPFSGTANTAVVSGEFPIGTHSILWTFSDQCGNVTSCLQDFTIANCKAPTPYCLNGLAVDLMPVDNDGDGQVDDGMVELWASDFDAGSFHSCPDYDVVVSFSENPLDTGRVFTCDSIGDAQVRIYATAIDKYGNYVLDTAGNYLQAWCNTFVDVQDNMNACSGDSLNRVAITGSIVADNGQSLNDAEVSLMDGSSELMRAETDFSGNYAFASMPMGGSYMVSPKKDGDDDLGVSTLDLVLIQRHILGMADLESATKIIAADVNHDEVITGADVVTLRKLILGKISEYPDNDSWRFLDNSYTFIDETDPLSEAFKETYNIYNLTSDMTVDFTAIKVGDVNNSANLDGSEATENRSSRIVLETEGAILTNNGQYTLPVELQKDMSITGMQFTMTIDDPVSIQSITSDVLDITDANMHILGNTVVFSYHSMNQVEVRAGDVLFNVVYEGAFDASTQLEISSDVITAEIYDDALNVSGLSLNYRGATDNVVLYQNTPNPFMDNTTINVYMPRDARANLSIYDINGKLLKSYNNDLTKGMNTITVGKDELAASGVLFYTLSTADFTATKRMVVLK